MTRVAIAVTASAGLICAASQPAGAATTHTSSANLRSTLASLAARQQKTAAPVIGRQNIPLVKVNANGTLDPNAVSPARCHLAPSTKPTATAGTISDAHPSTSVPGAIKVNSYIVCDYPVQALANETQLWKTGFLGFDHLQADTTTYNAGQRVLPNLQTYRHCTNADSTTWYGTAYGISEEGGQLYEGYGASPNNRTYNCGT